MPQNENNNASETSKNTSVYLEGFIYEFREALQDEIKEIEKSGLSSILLKEGHRLYSSSGFWYQFKIDYLPSIPADTPCKLTIGNENYDVTVIAFDDSSLTIEAKEELPNTIAEAKLENGTTVLLELLIKRIENNSTKANPAGLRMMHASDEGIQVVDSNDTISFDDNLDEAQMKAITSAVCNNTTFIWGPPGTGKTTVISHVITELLKRDRSVLLVSHTNSAVNGAIKKVGEKYYDKNNDFSKGQYPILRLGSGGKELDERLQLDFQVEKASHDLVLQKEQLEKEYSEIQLFVKAIQITLTKIDWVGKTHVMSLEQLARQISEISNLIDSKRNELSDLNTLIQEQLDSHPEYQDAVALKQTAEFADAVITTLNQDITEIKSEIETLTEKINNAIDEVAIHEQHKELKEKEAKYFSEKTLLSKMEECKSKIKSYEQLIDKNEKAISDSKAIIQQYEAKSSLGKLFANKRDYDQAKSTLDRLSKANENNRRNLEAIKLTLQGYETQLIELTAIKSQLAGLKPTKTKLFWESQMKTSISQKDSLELELEQKEKSLKETSLKKEEALSKLQAIADVCNTIDGLLANRNNAEKELSDLQVKHNDYKSRFAELIAIENELCHGVYFVQESTDTENIEALKNSIENAKAEITDVDSEKIKNEQKELSKRQEVIETELKQLDEQIAKVSTQIILNAKVIGTTLAKSYLSDEIQSRVFDTIILDEASMAAIPALWCAAQVTEKNIVIVGDFLQLPPIVMAKTDMAKKWLGRDIFHVSGAQELFKSENVEKRPRNYIMLDLQFRMDEEIADIVNLYYSEYCPLRSNVNSDKKKEERKDFCEWYNLDFEQDLYSFIRKENNIESCIHLFDTKSLNAWVTSVPTSKNSNSRMNVFSAVLSVELAFKVLERKIKGFVEPEKAPLVLIVAPYKAHIKRIEQLIQDKYRAFGLPDNSNLIQAGTIHSFQGKEAPIVIFDLVIDEPHRLAGIFDNKEEVDKENRKMFNVAISRAKFKLFFVGNFDYCVKKAGTSALGSLLKYLMSIKKYQLIDSKMHFPQMTYTRPSSNASTNNYTSEKCLGSVFISKLQTEIQCAKHRIIIYSPFLTANAITQLLPYFVDAINRNCEIVIITKPIEEFQGHERQRRLECEAILLKNNLQIVHKKKMHEKFAFIDDEIVWTGSLNILSFNGNTQEVMSRCYSKTNSQEWFELLDIQHVLDALHSKEELKCPVCGKEVMMAESKDSGYYWLCSNSQGCGWNRNPRSQYPHDGKLVCPECGGNYEFAMNGNKPIWRCKNKPTHYCFIRKSDLKLFKMWTNIPNDKIERVKAYFHLLNNDNGQLSLF